MGIKGQIASKKTPVVRPYFNNHRGADAVVNVLSVQGNRGQNLTVEHEKA